MLYMYSKLYTCSIAEDALNVHREVQHWSKQGTHNKKLRKLSFKINKRKHYFSNMVIDVWNNLPQEEISAKSVKDFEIAIYDQWKNQEMKYK